MRRVAIWGLFFPVLDGFSRTNFGQNPDRLQPLAYSLGVTGSNLPDQRSVAQRSWPDTGTRGVSFTGVERLKNTPYRHLTPLRRLFLLIAPLDRPVNTVILL